MNHLGDTNKMVGEDHIRDATKMVSETLRTDGLLTAILDSDGFVHNGNCPQRWVNYARELERELNAANQRIKRLEEMYEGVIGEKPELLGSNVMGLLKRELNFAQNRIKRLEEAGDNLHFGWIDGYLDPRCLNEWRKAKEAKP